MNKELKLLPVGVENFREIRKNNFYYIDKTALIEKLLNTWGKANLFTRPRRFGKSLNMSMLKYFFEYGCDKTLFDGLYISHNKDLCDKYMGKFPVVHISLKSVNADTFESAKIRLAKVINEEARRLQFLLQSDMLSDIDKALFRPLLDNKMEQDTLEYSIRELTELLNKHYNRQVIVLIDEYDVPLAKANEHGYYDEMTSLIRNLFENALKTNDNLYFSVLTGCLRIAKESIFTGLNNFKVYSITATSFDEYFGFTDKEIRELLEYYNQTENYETIKEWYDGYRFGNVNVYCPWDVICYCSDLIDNPKKKPENYWLNTSSNNVIYHFIDNISGHHHMTKAELEELVNGGTVQKEICTELTYKDLYSTDDNIWSALFMTGYLTERGERDGNRYNLVIPNREIRNIITEHILTLFKEQIKKDGTTLSAFCLALSTGNAPKVEQIFTAYMNKTISVRDTFVRKPTKENFYHGILLGIVGFKDGWTVKSNKESGDGFSDIMIRIDDSNIGIIIEVKYAEDGQLLTECQKALKQIVKNNYTAEMKESGIHSIFKYAIACNRKKCKVLMEKE